MKVYVLLGFIIMSLAVFLGLGQGNAISQGSKMLNHLSENTSVSRQAAMLGFEVFGTGRDGDLVIPAGQVVYGDDARAGLISQVQAGERTFTMAKVSSFFFGAGTWQDTGIELSAGQWFAVDVVGTGCPEWHDDQGCYRGPNGEGTADSSFPVPGAPMYSIVAKVGMDGVGFFAGSHYEGTTTQSGHLYLVFNDNNIGNNYLTYGVTVRTQPIEFDVGDEILIVQMQGNGAGSYEFGVIESLSANGQITLVTPLQNTYTPRPYLGGATLCPDSNYGGRCETFQPTMDDGFLRDNYCGWSPSNDVPNASSIRMDGDYRAMLYRKAVWRAQEGTELFTQSDSNLGDNVIGDNNTWSIRARANNAAQIVKVSHYLDVRVHGTWATHPWDGWTGGMLAFRSSQGVYVDSVGAINASGVGFVGGKMSAERAPGSGGEGSLINGPGFDFTSANGGGGGGGQGNYQGDSNAAAGGGGGGYGTAGASGQNSPTGEAGGAGGEMYGNTELSLLFPGSGGGSGGGDHTCCEGRNGAGGVGGGILVLYTRQIKLYGTIQADGADGLDARYQPSGAGGGGSGGSIRIIASYVDIGDSRMTAIGGQGGSSVQAGLSRPVGGAGGNGGFGRVHIEAQVVNGSTNPPYDFRQLTFYDVFITGPLTGTTNTPYTFSAIVNPVTATQPITYVWQAGGQEPVIHTNGLSDTITFTWGITGVQVITVTAMNATDVATNTHFVVVVAPLPSWTFLVYLDGDNDLDAWTDDLFNKLEAAANNPHVNILVQWDRHPGGLWDPGTCRYKVQFDAHLGRLAGYTEGVNRWCLGELNMGDKQTLADFITWAKANSPAGHYFLSIFDHGGGWSPELPPPYQGWSMGGAGLSWDDTDMDYLSNYEMRWIFEQTGHMDVVFYDACLMGMLENAYELNGNVDYLVASESVEYATIPYDYYISVITKAMTPASLAEAIVSVYMASLPPGYSGSMAALQLSQTDNITTAVNSLAQAMIAVLPDTGARDQIAGAYLATQKIDYDSDWVLEPGREGFVDLYHFAQQTATFVTNTQVISAAQGVMMALEGGFVLAESHRSGYPYTATLTSLHGVSIYVPFGEELYVGKECISRTLDICGVQAGPACIKMRQYYTTTVLPQTSQVRLAQDTQWDEFVNGFIVAYYHCQMIQQLTGDGHTGVLPTERPVNVLHDPRRRASVIPVRAIYLPLVLKSP